MLRRLLLLSALVIGLVPSVAAPASGEEGNAALPGSNPQVVWVDTPVNDVVFSDDGSRAFVSGEREHLVVAFELPGWSFAGLVDVGGRPFGMDLTHDGQLLVAVAEIGEVVEIDPDSLTITDRVDLDPVLRYLDLRDVMEVDPGVVLVTNADPRENPVRYERADPAGTAAEIAADGRNSWSIIGDPGLGSVYLGRSSIPQVWVVDTTDPTFPDDGVIEHDESGDSRYSAFDAARDRIYTRDGVVISTSSRSVVGQLDFGPVALSHDGSELYQVSSSTALNERVLTVYDADTLTATRSFSPSCHGFGVYTAAIQVHLDPAGENLVIIGDDGVCLEPVDGSGVSAVRASFQAVDPGAEPSINARFAVFDAEDRLVYESDARESGAWGLRLIPGEYRVLFYDVLASDRWPYFSGWHDGTPLLARDVPAPLMVTQDGTIELPASPIFYDLREASDTYWDAVVWLRLTAITTGCERTRFCPNDFVTRGQMAAFLDRALDLPLGGPSGFVDDAGTFQRNIWNLKAAGITRGCAPDRFCTDDFVTRGEMAAFLDRALDLPLGGPSGFVDDVGTFQQNIWNLREAGITTGCAPDRFCTNDFVTRAQMALFLERALAASWPDV